MQKKKKECNRKKKEEVNIVSKRNEKRSCLFILFFVLSWGGMAIKDNFNNSL